MDGPRDSEASDDALVAAARAGRNSALDTLIRRHEATVLRVLRLLGVPTQDREDVAQEVFVRVFRHLGGFHRGRPFGGWLYRISVNAAHDYRLRARRRGVEQTWPETLDPSAGERHGPEADLRARERRRALEGALARLSERERAVFVLCEIEALTSREVAGALGITQITVRRHLGRARRHLQRLLRDEKSPESGEFEKESPGVERPLPEGGSKG